MITVKDQAARLRSLKPRVLRTTDEAHHSVGVSYERGWDYLAARSAQLRTRATEEEPKIGISPFLGYKSLKPVLGAGVRRGEGDA